MSPYVCQNYYVRVTPINSSGLGSNAVGAQASKPVAQKTGPNRTVTVYF